MGTLKEFRDSAFRRSVVDLAVAVIIGAAFGAIISTLVDKVITPLLLTPALQAAFAQDFDKLIFVAVQYGLVLAAVIKFVIVAFVLFLIVKGMKSIENKKVPAPTGQVLPKNCLQKSRTNSKNHHWSNFRLFYPAAI